MNKWMLKGLALCALAALTGCGGVRTGEASVEEVALVKEVLAAYHEQALALPDEAREKLPAWLADAESFQVLKVEKMNGTLKALVQFTSGSETTTKYAMLRKDEQGNYRVAGFL